MFLPMQRHLSVIRVLFRIKMSLFANAVRILEQLTVSVRRTPLFVWLYLGVVLYIYRRMTRDFLGKGTRRMTILGQSVSLSVEEEAVAGDIINPDDIKDRFEMVGGLTSSKQILLERVIWPFCRPELFRNISGSLHPSGILLYGPPGTGKTLLARALAKELNGYFLDVKLERLFSKWVGESEKLAAAVFSLAEKLQPCVIFIDEVDSILSSRDVSDSPVYNHAKSIFMTKWDGIHQNDSCKILVIGTTNRPHALDDAVLRRFPIRVEVGYPDVTARQEIFKIHLGDAFRQQDDAAELLDRLASLTVGYSGSDIKELCKAARLMPIREFMQSKDANKLHGSAPSPILRLEHFKEAMRSVGATSTF